MADRRGHVMRRLSLATLGSIPVAARPAVDPMAVEVGIVHLGIGAFHRAHQAVYTEAAMAATGDLQWGICGVTQRSARVAEQLAPQDGLYTVLVRGSGHPQPHVVGAVREVMSGVDRRGDVVSLIAEPQVRVVSLTVSEKGYRHDPATGRLRADDPGLQADLASGPDVAPVTVVGQLARGIQQRMRRGGDPLTVLCCDNLPNNGAVVHDLVTDFASLLPTAEATELLDWTGANVRFPVTMVDRIVPATTAADRSEVERLLGVADLGVVVAEPFYQWVIEDSFGTQRPAWERVGATLTTDVEPYETMKLRLLNGSHFALAYLGALAGHNYIADVMLEDRFVSYVRGLMDLDAEPTLSVPDGFDVEHYKDQLLERFANPGLLHRTTQVAMDGSQKLPQRLLGTIRDRRRAGAEPHHALLALAAWMRYVSAGTSDAGQPLPVDDPLADRLRALTARARRPSEVVDALLGVTEVFGTDLREDATVRRLLSDDLRILADAGAVAAVASLSDSVTT